MFLRWDHTSCNSLQHVHVLIIGQLVVVTKLLREYSLVGETTPASNLAGSFVNAPCIVVTLLYRTRSIQSQTNCSFLPH